MYDSKELIQKSAARNMLNDLFTQTLADLPQKSIIITDTKNIDMRKILSGLKANDLLVTNDNYINESCDYQVLNNEGSVLVTIVRGSEDVLINKYSQQACLEDESICDRLSKVYDIIRNADNCVNIITTAA